MQYNILDAPDPHRLKVIEESEGNGWAPWVQGGVQGMLRGGGWWG